MHRLPPASGMLNNKSAISDGDWTIAFITDLITKSAHIPADKIFPYIEKENVQLDIEGRRGAYDLYYISSAKRFYAIDPQDDSYVATAKYP